MGRHFEVRAAAMAKTSAANAKLYSRFSKEIYVAAKAGDPNPDMNQGLKKTIERAKANSIPASVIERAIEKAKGGSNDSYASSTYEGFGAGASTIIIECLTDNQNRTIADLRTAFNKSHAKLGVAGSVSFNYQHVGNIVLAYTDEEAMLDALISGDVDVKEVEVEGENMNVLVEPSDLYKAKDAIEALIPGVEFDTLELSMIANEYVSLEGEELELFKRLVTMLDDVDDVQNVWHNVENLNDAE